MLQQAGRWELAGDVSDPWIALGPVHGLDRARPLHLGSNLMNHADCLFCKIVAGDIPADVVHRTEEIVAFRDIHPKAPVHVLVIPTAHVTSLDTAGDHDRDVLGRIMLAARDVARAEGVSETGYRAVINTGDDGGQTVQHVHLHVLGGRALGWPPG